MIGRSGMVFAADTEESWGERGDIKTATTKIMSGIRTGPGDPCALAVAGSGDADYLQAVKLELISATFLSEKWTYDTSANLMERYLTKFYRKHVVPFWPNIQDFQLLIGVAKDSGGAIWATSKSTLRPCYDGYEAIGAGRAYATGLMSRFHTITMELETCALLAIHVIYCVKEFIGGCGKQTQIVVLSGGAEPVLVDQSKTDEAERLLKRIFHLDAALLQFVLSGRNDLISIQRESQTLRSQLVALDLFNLAGC